MCIDLQAQQKKEVNPDFPINQKNRWQIRNAELQNLKNVCEEATTR
jgi:hypothetical protein